MASEPVYITFEGLEGVGKSFFLKKLKEKYPDEFFVLLDDDLDGFGLTLFQVLLQKEDLFMRQYDPVIEFLCFTSVDYDSFKRKALPALNKDKIVLQDRGAHTTCLYSGLRMEGDLEDNIKWLMDIRQRISKTPDHVILLIDDFKKCVERAEKRNGRKYTENELSFLEKIDKGFRTLMTMYPERIHVLKREQTTPEEMLEQIYTLIKGLC